MTQADLPVRPAERTYIQQQLQFAPSIVFGARPVSLEKFHQAILVIEITGSSLADLRELFSRDPRLSPDARLRALRRLRLSTLGRVAELARRSEMELSFSVLARLKPGRSAAFLPEKP